MAILAPALSQTYVRYACIQFLGDNTRFVRQCSTIECESDKEHKRLQKRGSFWSRCRTRRPSPVSRIKILLVVLLLMALSSPVEAAPSQAQGTPGKMAFIRNGHLWLWEAGREREVSTGPKDSSPRLSPSGCYIAFAREKELWLATTDGDRRWRVATTVGSFDWAPTEDRLAISTESGLSTVVVTTAGPRRPSLLAAGWSSPAWSPDGQTLAVVRNTPGSTPFSGTTSIGLLPRTGGEPRIVLQAPYPHGASCGPVGGVSGLSWSADGRWQALLRCGLWASLSADCGELAVMPSEGGEPTPVAAVPAQANWSTWAPKGAVLAFVDGAGRDAWTNKSLRVVAMPPGPAAVTLTPPGYADRDPAWSLDGKRLAFTRSRTEWPEKMTLPALGQSIWISDYPRGGAEQVPGSEQGFAPQWGPGGGLAWFHGVGGEQGSLWYVGAPGQAKVRLITGIDLPFPYYGEWHLEMVFDWWRPVHF